MSKKKHQNIINLPLHSEFFFLRSEFIRVQDCQSGHQFLDFHSSYFSLSSEKKIIVKDTNIYKFIQGILNSKRYFVKRRKKSFVLFQIIYDITIQTHYILFKEGGSVLIYFTIVNLQIHRRESANSEKRMQKHLS